MLLKIPTTKQVNCSLFLTQAKGEMACEKKSCRNFWSTFVFSLLLTLDARNKIFFHINFSDKCAIVFHFFLSIYLQNILNSALLICHVFDFDIEGAKKTSPFLALYQF